MCTLYSAPWEAVLCDLCESKLYYVTLYSVLCTVCERRLYPVLYTLYLLWEEAVPLLCTLYLMWEEDLLYTLYSILCTFCERRLYPVLYPLYLMWEEDLLSTLYSAPYVRGGCTLYSVLCTFCERRVYSPSLLPPPPLVAPLTTSFGQATTGQRSEIFFVSQLMRDSSNWGGRKREYSIQDVVISSRQNIKKRVNYFTLFHGGWMGLGYLFIFLLWALLLPQELSQTRFL